MHDSIADSSDLEFFGHIFSEHCLLISRLMVRLNIIDPKLLRSLKSIRLEWLAVQNDSRAFTPNLIDDTYNVKIKASKLLDNNKCLPDLVQHMIEELEYFEKSVVNGEWSLDQEISYWAREHAESLGFVACQLPVLVLNDKVGEEIPSDIEQLLKDGDQLKTKFEDLSNEGKGWFASLFGKTMTDDQKLYKMHKLTNIYIDSIDSLLDSIDSLPLREGTKAMLSDMLNHEREEAIWSDERISSYTVSF